jgi:flavin reductase (DIM6/NTAB) family NADH-FMN oxidoreductase RutF
MVLMDDSLIRKDFAPCSFNTTIVFDLTRPRRTIMMKETMEKTQTTTLDSESLRAAMRAWSAGVTVVTALHEGQRHGMTVNSFTSISLEPALITISLQNGTRTQEMVSKSRTFALTILASTQAQISDLFAGRIQDTEDRFTNVQTETLVTGAPLIVGGLAWMDCRVLETYNAGTNTLFIAEVLAARGTGEGQPLIYHNRNYWRLSEFL